MICIIALVVFAVLGIFSAKYRAYFSEALDCVFKRVTLRKCTTSFDKKMKLKITTRLSGVNKSLGGFVFKNFETISWIFTIIMIVSMIWSLYVGVLGVYNWVAFGNCYGPDSTQACVLNTLTGKVEPNTSAIITDTNIVCDYNTLMRKTG
ncbi:MAG: hypothetical protein WCW13_06845 [archaeon]|jgi:hypothetical protein